MRERAYKESQLNSELYSKWRIKFDDFFESERYFFIQKDLMTSNMTILDVGGDVVD